MLRTLAVWALVGACGPLAAQNVALNGSMGDRALLIIDGTPRMVPVGGTVGGVKLLAVADGEAQVEVGGKKLLLRIGAAPANLGGAGGPSGGSAIVLHAGPGGHFIANGAINGRPVQFMVDTGATSIAMSLDEAQRIGLDLSQGRRGMASTANGNVPTVHVVLSSVRIGDVEVANVAAAVVPMPMQHILLGNSFLTRFQMKRENDVLRLEKR